MQNKEKILVLMSGGVDSSTTAALLNKKGYDLSGVYLKLYESKDGNEIGEPCWAKEMRDAARVAAKLNIPFQVWDVTKEYKERVLSNFYNEYNLGRTPNPDVLCNSEIKFGIALDKALKLGFDFVATGHYARIENGELYTGIDNNKDQSYFLWKLSKEQLSHAIFPLGEYTKDKVREIAKELDLHNFDKKDSQGVCFLGKIDLGKFIKPFVKMEKGPIVDVVKGVVGEHNGLAQFTIGQRHGGGIGDGGGPYYVVYKDSDKNALIVANEEEELKYRAIGCIMVDINKCGEIKGNMKARVRYRGELVNVEVDGSNIKFETPQRAIAAGQSIVFYNKDKVIGGGIIDKVTLCNQVK